MKSRSSDIGSATLALPAAAAALPGQSRAGVVRLAALVVTLTVTAFLAILNAQVLTPVVPSMAAELRVSEAAIGQLVTAASIAGLLLGLIAGPLSDRYGRRPVMLLAAVLLALTSLGSAACHAYLPLLVLRFLGGVGSVLLLPAALAALGDFVPPRLQSRAMGCVMAGTGLSLVVGWPLAALTAARWSWRGLFVTMGLSFVVLCALVLATLPAAKASPSSAPASTVGDYRRLLGDREVLLALLATGLAAAAWFGFTTFLGSLFAHREIVRLERQPVVLAGVGLLYAIGSMISGMLMPRVGERPAAALCCVAGAVALGALAVPELTAISALALTAVVAGARGAAVTALNSVVVALRPGERGRVAGLNAVAFSVGVFIGAGSGGLALAAAGHVGLQLLLSALSLAAGVTMFRLGPRAEAPTA